MATVIQVGENRFIAGDPDTTLACENHWCEWCNGDGLEVGFDDEFAPCGSCSGFGLVKCDDAECELHRSTSQPTN